MIKQFIGIYYNKNVANYTIIFRKNQSINEHTNIEP